MYTLSTTINGIRVTRQVSPQHMLCDFLRDDLGLHGTHVNCREGACGSCMVLVNGQQVSSCLMLAFQVEGCQVTTIEGLAGTHPLQQAFKEHGALQCGYCTPGMLLSAVALLQANPEPSKAEIRAHLGGNICRCTGYVKIVEAIQSRVSA